ncbi:MAG: UpxY family transcription antiterminator [Bacteroidales bacterium]|nr:UpxY family transcription antiterminator [Bacteroidales bacterium]
MEEQKWYAIKVFFNRVPAVLQMLDTRSVEYYAQTIIPSYVFIRTAEKEAEKLRSDLYQYFYLYSDRETRKPTAIPEKEMNIFRIITSSGDTGLEFLGEDPTRWQQGDKVRVKDGPFKGAEGYIRRIKKDRRLVVTVSGLAAIATSYIHPSLLEKVEAWCTEG